MGTKISQMTAKLSAAHDRVELAVPPQSNFISGFPATQDGMPYQTSSTRAGDIALMSPNRFSFRFNAILDSTSKAYIRIPAEVLMRIMATAMVTSSINSDDMVPHILDLTEMEDQGIPLDQINVKGAHLKLNYGVASRNSSDYEATYQVESDLYGIDMNEGWMWYARSIGAGLPMTPPKPIAPTREWTADNDGEEYAAMYEWDIEHIASVPMLVPVDVDEDMPSSGYFYNGHQFTISLGYGIGDYERPYDVVISGYVDISLTLTHYDIGGA